MLILVGSDGNSLESPVAKRFGHANYFILFNMETKTFEAFENIAEEHNHDNLQNFLDNGVEAFIVGNVGPHAFEIINTPRSKVYLARKMSVQQAIDNSLIDELQQLFEPTVKKSIGHNLDQGKGKHHHHNN
jgi:predicted Fe-Mo cluster-binding NifX family protein